MNRAPLIAATVLFCFLFGSCIAIAQDPWASIPDAEQIVDIDSFLLSCPSADELAILQADFPILFEPAMRFRDPLYNCLEPTSTIRAISDQLVITQALRVIRHMKLFQPLPWTDLHPYEWLKSKIGAISVSYTAAYNSCCHTVFPINKPGGVLAITLQKVSDDLLRYRMQWRDPSAGTGLGNLILLVFHEARHVDLPHDCEGIYDSSLDYMGAWGVQITMARYLVEGWIDIGLHADELPHLEWLADSLTSSRMCAEAD
jgi:hypothetical protein